MTHLKTLPKIDPKVLDDLVAKGLVEIQLMIISGSLFVFSYAKEDLMLTCVDGSTVVLTPGECLLIQGSWLHALL